LVCESEVERNLRRTFFSAGNVFMIAHCNCSSGCVKSVQPSAVVLPASLEAISALL
jgi:hypothetical protein